jgi:hypothetical protein
VDGLTISGNDVTVKSLVVNRFSRDGIRITAGSDATIQGCAIGTDAGGSSSQPNGANGISITGGLRALIGGPSTSAGNVISGNGGSGISISASLADVQGNMIGTNRPISGITVTASRSIRRTARMSAAPRRSSATSSPATTRTASRSSATEARGSPTRSSAT